MTTSPSQAELVTIAVYLLGGDRRPVDTEDVAVKAHELAPTRFAWRKYPEQINLELVRVYLSDAKKVDKGSLLEGSGKTGWSLTANGRKWIESIGEGLAGVHLDRPRARSAGGPLDEQRWRRERDRILATAAWATWASGSREVSAKEASEVFRIDSYAVGRLREFKVQRVLQQFSEDVEISQFLDAMANLVNDEGTDP